MTRASQNMQQKKNEKYAILTFKNFWRLSRNKKLYFEKCLLHSTDVN